MSHLIDKYGGKTTILTGLLLQALELLLLSFSKRRWMMWISGIIASLSSITYPALSAYISTYADADKQGLVQGLITGVRSLCSGIGPAMFGLLFYIFDVDMYEVIRANPYSPNTAQDPAKPIPTDLDPNAIIDTQNFHSHRIPPLPPMSAAARRPVDSYEYMSNWIVGPPFLIGAILVLLATVVATFIPDTIMSYRRPQTKSNAAQYYRYTNVSSNGNCENGDLQTVINDTDPLDYEVCRLDDD